MPLYDCHNHLQDPRLTTELPDIVKTLRKAGVVRWGVNATREADWPDVAVLADAYHEVVPFFGLHPWFIDEANPGWEDRLRALLSERPGAGIGEIGLDRWVDGYDLPAQERIFVAQLKIAAEMNRPVAIHCLRAWGRLYEILRDDPRPAGSFLLHSYGGPAEMVQPFADLGAYFSLSGYFAHERKAKQCAVFQKMPRDRLLLETDAPDMAPPEAWNGFPMPLAADARPVNSPANITAVYAFAAELLDEPMDRLTAQIETNARRFLNFRH